MKKLLGVAFIVSVVGLSACETMDERVAEYETFSCFQLAREIGRYEHALDVAKTDKLESDLTQIFTDDDDEEEQAWWDSFIADGNADDARENLNALERIRYRKGC